MKGVKKMCCEHGEIVKVHQKIEKVHLWALPGSGKSELIAWLESLLYEQRLAKYGLGYIVHLDDFPWIFIMRSIDRALKEMGLPPAFFYAEDDYFIHPEISWSMIMFILHREYRMIEERRQYALADSNCGNDALLILDEVRKELGVPPLFSSNGILGLTIDQYFDLKSKIYQVVYDQFFKKNRAFPADGLHDKTLFIEIARGGPKGWPQDKKLLIDGFEHSVRYMDPQMMDKAGVLYMQVSPEETLRRNEVRSDPDNPGSTLRHKVPLRVMERCYAMTDFFRMCQKSHIPNCLIVKTKGDFRLTVPCATFDNEDDKTSIFRSEQPWPQAEVAKMEQEFSKIWMPFMENYFRIWQQPIF